jgi:hypothetical protein
MEMQFASTGSFRFYIYISSYLHKHTLLTVEFLHFFTDMLVYESVISYFCNTKYLEI